MASLIPAGAETVLVTTGEHEGYTRIVFKVVPPLDWKLQPGNRAVELQFPAQSLEFDETAVFNRISNDRLTDVHSANTATGAIFQMSLGCDCEVTAFEHLHNYIVVDISDSKTETSTLAETTHRTPYLESPTPRSQDAGLVASIPWRTPVAPSFVSSSDLSNFPAINSEVSVVGMTMVSMPDELPVSVPEPDAVSEVEVDQNSTELQENISNARNSLLEQLTMAAEQGLLEFTLQQELPIEELEVETIEILKEVDSFEEELPKDPRQVNFQTVFDRDAGIANTQSIEEATQCISKERLDIASWGSGQDFNTEISEIRSNLLLEFDIPDPEATLKLIQLYLRYGFGVEAVSYLEEFKEEIPDFEVLRDLAFVVDGYPIDPSGQLATAVECDGLVGLLAVVGTHPEEVERFGDTNSLIEAFASLPTDLRRLLGARFAMAFLDKGLLEESSKISDIMQRAPGEHGAEHDLTIAQIKQSEGHIEEAKEILIELADHSMETSVDALMSLAELQLKHGGPFSGGMLVDLGAAADEYRGTDKGIQLRRLEVLGLSKTAGGMAALEAITKEVELNPESSKILREVANQVLMDISPFDGSLQDYIEAVSRFQTFIDLDSRGDSLRLEIGRELSDAGFPNMANIVLLPLIDRQNLEGQLLSATAYLLMFRPELALEMLHDVSGDEASRIRVEAFLTQGKFDEALAEVATIHNHDMQKVDAAWYAGDWVSAGRNSAAAEEIRRNYLIDDGSYATPTTSLTTSSPEVDQLGTISNEELMTLSNIRGVLETSSAVSQELRNALLSR